MKKATISELKNRLSYYVRVVKQGESVLVIDRDTPVAELHPIEHAATPSKERLRALSLQGIIRPGATQKAKTFAFPPQGKRAGVVDALLEEREENR